MPKPKENKDPAKIPYYRRENSLSQPHFSYKRNPITIKKISLAIMFSIQKKTPSHDHLLQTFLELAASSAADWTRLHLALILQSLEPAPNTIPMEGMSAFQSSVLRSFNCRDADRAFQLRRDTLQV